MNSGEHKTPFEKQQEAALEKEKDEQQYKEAMEFVNRKIMDYQDSLDHYTSVDKDHARRAYAESELNHFLLIKAVLEKSHNK